MLVTQGNSLTSTTQVDTIMLLIILDCIELRKGEELKAPRHASAATTRNDRLPHSRHWQLFFCSCYLYTLIDYCYTKILSKEEEEEC